MVWAPPLVTEGFVPASDTELSVPQDLLDCLYKWNLMAWGNMIEFLNSLFYLNCVSCLAPVFCCASQNILGFFVTLKSQLR